jgi:dTDP-glucose 4,6-dehydratase
MAHVVLTGGAGFVGSHLCDALLARGDRVTAVDNFITGSPENVAHLADRPDFTLVEADVTKGVPVEGPVDAVLHFASLASPVHYFQKPIETLLSGSRGTEHCLALAQRYGARFLLASTSEVYGDPEVTPQPESYWGRVNPIGLRSCYDESKRYAEAATMAWHRVHGIDTRIVRIFNTYGPRMAFEDGRVLPAFLAAAEEGHPLVVHGDGQQTRSFCYVSDTVSGVLHVLDGDGIEPVNVGGPGETTIRAFAELVIEITGREARIESGPPNPDDPLRREPDLQRLRSLGWAPTVALRDGLQRTLDWYRNKRGAASPEA